MNGRKHSNIHTTSAGCFGVFVVGLPDPSSRGLRGAEDLYRAIGQHLEANQLEIVSEKVFASLDCVDELSGIRERELTARGLAGALPATLVEGRPAEGVGICGVAIHAVPCTAAAGPPRTIFSEGAPCGREWRMGDATCWYLADRHGSPVAGDRPTGTSATEYALKTADTVLKNQGASYSKVVRTWFYLENILDWYDDFNRDRSQAYDAFGLMPQAGGPLRLPASTGVAGRNRSGDPVAMEVFAIDPRGEVAVEMLTNAGQEEAFRYGSAFSRAACLDAKNIRLIRVSGTAAIDEQGATIYPGDIAGQICCTFDKIEQLISAKGASLMDIASATVFLKRPEYQTVFRRELSRRQLNRFPGIVTIADICRDDLLFEIDADVVVHKR